MYYLEDRDMVIYLCSPFVRSLKDLEDRKMHLADIPIHDVTRDLLWMELMARYILIFYSLNTATRRTKDTKQHYILQLIVDLLHALMF